MPASGNVSRLSVENSTEQRLYAANDIEAEQDRIAWPLCKWTLGLLKNKPQRC